MRRFIQAVGLAALVLSGCASVQVERAKDLSTAGVAYARATAAVIDLAIDAAIDADSEDRVRMGLAAATSNERGTRETDLRKSDDTLVKTVQSYTRLKRSVGSIEGYFAGLQALAGAEPGPATEASVKNLGDQVNGLNASLEKPQLVSDEKKGAIAAVAGLLVKQAHGAALARALERDAERISRALVLQELTLKAATGDVAASMNNLNARFYRDRVLTPYLAGGVGNAWVESRRTALKVQAIGTAPEAVAAASDAAARMQAVWGRILSGESSGDELMRMLKDTQDLLDAAIALKKAQ